MKDQKTLNKINLHDTLHVYLSQWKYFLISVILCLLLAFTFLRYSTNQYKSSTIIQLKDDKQTNKLPEISSLQGLGVISGDAKEVKDELEILKSKTLIEQVVKDLKLNISYHVQGVIKEKESYSAPPFNLTFFKDDSIINTIDTTFFVTVVSNSKFNITNEDPKTITSLGGNSDTGKTYNFGDKLNTSFGGIVITPNIGNYGSQIGVTTKIKFVPIDKLVETYQNGLQLDNAEGSKIIKISLNGAIQKKSEDFLNKLIQKYNDDVVQDKEEVIKVTSDFINNRLDIVSEELQQVDLTAETLKKDNRLSDLASQSNIFLQSERENEANLIATTNQIQLIDYMEQHLEQNNSNSDLLPANVGIEDPNIALVTKSHNDLVLQRNRILKNSSEKNPTVINLNNQIKALKDNLEQSLNNLKSSTQITLNSLKRTDSRINAQIYSTPAKERQFRDITRQQSIKESLYLYLLEKREETAITLGMSTANAKVVDPASTSNIPVSPKKLIVLLAALIFGLAIPFLFFYTKDLLDNKIHTKKDLTNILDIPFIAEIPKTTGKLTNVQKVDYSPKAEAFRILRTNLDFMLQNIKDRAKIIYITSTTSQEGKSHTATNLALSLSFSEKKVLLIETDIRVPRASLYLDFENKLGLTDFLSNNDLKAKDIIKSKKENPFLSIIPSGTIPPNPAELLMNDRYSDLIETIKNDFDYIIVDTAAVGLVTDTLLISKHADVFVYVVKANYLDKRSLHVADMMFTEKRLPNMTMLLNNVDHRRSYGYGYGYGYGNNPKKQKQWWQKYFPNKKV